MELLSWRRLDLHSSPVVFWNPDNFWDPLFKLFQHTVDEKLTPPEFMDAWTSVVDKDRGHRARPCSRGQQGGAPSAMLSVTMMLFSHGI